MASVYTLQLRQQSCYVAAALLHQMPLLVFHASSVLCVTPMLLQARLQSQFTPNKFAGTLDTAKGATASASANLSGKKKAASLASTLEAVAKQMHIQMGGLKKKLPKSVSIAKNQLNKEVTLEFRKMLPQFNITKSALKSSLTELLPSLTGLVSDVAGAIGKK